MSEQNADTVRCPSWGARTAKTTLFSLIICANIGCPWFLTLADGKEHFRA